MLSITKSITLQGAGSSATVITNLSGSPSIQLNPTSDKAIRVTGFGFLDSSYVVQIIGSRTGSYCLTKLRVDHCAFTGGSQGVESVGWVESLIDHNYFLNVNRAILIIGDDNYAWTRTIAAGTQHALFIEDNTFKWTNGIGGLANENVYHQEGARTVIRYNTFDGTECTSYDFLAIDSHGNGDYYEGNNNDARGQPIVEVYNNTFSYHHSYRVCYIRGGSILFHDNAFSYVTSSVEISLTDEESWQTLNFNPLRTTWPAQDQIFNSFFWNNTRNGSPITDVVVANASTFIQKDRDYFMHAPQSTGGYEYFTGLRQGGSQSPPTQSDTGSMSFSASGASAYYPYTPTPYPNALQGSGENVLNPPARLRIKS